MNNEHYYYNEYDHDFRNNLVYFLENTLFLFDTKFRPLWYPETLLGGKIGLVAFLIWNFCIISVLDETIVNAQDLDSLPKYLKWYL